MARYDLVLVGGGLANALIAWRLRQRRPELRVLLVEREDRLGGSHTWSFFATDVTHEQRAWLDPLVTCRWPGYTVRFPHFSRLLCTPYAAISSDRLHALLSGLLGDDCWCGADAYAVGASHVCLSDGRTVRAAAVIDGRGQVDSTHLALAYQKFLGLEVRLAAPHGLSLPVIMDADVPQIDGYRFLYVLPLDEERLLIEDTRYSDSASLDPPRLRAAIEQYATARGWIVRDELRLERGVLPIALAGDIGAFWESGPPGVPRSGLRAALFHPTTGYSLPDAVALADLVAGMPVLESAGLLAAIRDHSSHLWARRRYFRMLNRMLFGAGDPSARHRVFRRFYGLPEPLIERFYAARPTVVDRWRLLVGTPPVPVLPALRCVPEGAWLRSQGAPS